MKLVKLNKDVWINPDQISCITPITRNNSEGAEKTTIGCTIWYSSAMKDSVFNTKVYFGEDIPSIEDVISKLQA